MNLLRNRWLTALLVLLLLAAPLPARTITLTDADCDRMAVIAEDAPLFSWAGHNAETGVYSAIYADLYGPKAVLMSFPIEKIPKGQRITRAELMLPVILTSAGEHKLHVRRLLAEWGPGVCYQYRMTRPKKLEWKEAGARGSATDRAPQASAVARVNGPGEVVVNLTEDVELWYTGAGNNHGWILTAEDPSILIRLGSPIGIGKGGWKLRITYEPE